MKKLEMAFCILCSVVLMWGLASLFNINAHNMTDHEYAKWNVFVIMFPVEDEPQEETVQYNNVCVKTVVSATEEPVPTNEPKKKVKARKQKKNKKKEAKEKDILNLARIIQAENGGHEDDEALLLTGVVVMKRVKSDEYPNTIMGVVSQKGQYSTYADGKFWNNPSKRSRKIAKKILETDIVDKYPDNLVFQAEFKQGKVVYKMLGNEYFCLA